MAKHQIAYGHTDRKFQIDEGQRQLIILGLAELALSRPGLDEALKEVAKTFCAEELFDNFKNCNRDRVRETHADMRGVFLDGSKTETELPEKKVYLLLEELLRLPDYSGSVPTGAKIGTKWRRAVPNNALELGDWIQGEYIPHPIKTGMSTIEWKHIIICE